MRREYERVTCPGCGRTVSAYVPHMGDGSALRTVKHRDWDKPEQLECSLSQRLVQFNSRLGAWEFSL